jgi:hypothetical protein
MKTQCSECDVKLWSDLSKERGMCPECFEPDREVLDLEDELEKILEEQ